MHTRPISIITIQLLTHGDSLEYILGEFDEYFIVIAIKDDFSSTLILFMGRQYFWKEFQPHLSRCHTLSSKKKVQLYFSFLIVLSQQ